MALLESVGNGAGLPFDEMLLARNNPIKSHSLPSVLQPGLDNVIEIYHFRTNKPSHRKQTPANAANYSEEEF